METTVISAIIGACAVIITTILTSYFTKKARIKLEERKLKEIYYIEFIKAFSDNINEDDESKAVKSICYAQNNLFLIASVEVINRMQYLDLMCINNGRDFEGKTGIKKGTEQFIAEYDKRLQLLMVAIRNDLYGKNETNTYPIIHLKTHKRQ